MLNDILDIFRNGFSGKKKNSNFSEYYKIPQNQT